jgi:hypothetical protein
MAPTTLTVGTVQVTAVCDVTGDFPAPLERAFPAVPPAAWAPWRRGWSCSASPVCPWP